MRKIWKLLVHKGEERSTRRKQSAWTRGRPVSHSSRRQVTVVVVRGALVIVVAAVLLRAVGVFVVVV